MLRPGLRAMPVTGCVMVSQPACLNTAANASFSAVGSASPGETANQTLRIGPCSAASAWSIAARSASVSSRPGRAAARGAAVVEVDGGEEAGRSGAPHAVRTTSTASDRRIFMRRSLATADRRRARPPPMAVVEISTGRLAGTREGGVVAFKGIPFARPPVGALRFAPPQLPEPWSGVRDATRFGPAAPQTPDLIGPTVGFDQPASAEDCLTVN